MSDGDEVGAVHADGDGQRCGFIAVIGAPNAGKSTLVNAMVGAKVSIVSHKVQTTRVPVRGIANVGNSQLVFIDTPGLFSPKKRLDTAMVEAAWGGARDADFVVLVIDAARGIDAEVESILNKLQDVKLPRIAVLNKVDKLTDKSKLLELATAVQEKAAFEHVFMLSATDGDGVEDLKRYLADKMPAGPWHYPEDDLTDAPLRMLAAEITREKIFHRLHDEVPYSSTVETSQWTERKDGSVRIEQTIFVARDGQKAIMLGKGGATIKQVSMDSRRELQEILERPVHLFLFVKVRENWQDDPERYREMGLELPKK
ncbi:GTPase Era [Hyphomicrobium sulfonivorans]|uniref:GTPase Era n=1 Tax=Hyphomicrobium sulfonivorans TaxID=121290 RepID=A0A120CUB9_HYPSL|nr:GTPase Era [Hyphomicrobium sulfonivorans]KWT66012.1 GTP-binding protein Era [Hyphomicrobium sulfonivorans]MBI1650482.1 GTPase Era [Hyphomicrobium sulfonivorans]NSL72159.1 GTPase Era [Hyphomicrobium sulfonivorans]